MRTTKTAEPFAYLDKGAGRALLPRTHKCRIDTSMLLGVAGVRGWTKVQLQTLLRCDTWRAFVMMLFRHIVFAGFD